MDEVPDDMFAAMGSNANCIFVIPSLNLVVARQGMDPDEDEAFFNNEMCRKLLEACITYHVSRITYHHNM